MVVNISVLTGSVIRAISLIDYYRRGIFKHSLWVDGEHTKLFENHPILHTVKAIEGEQPFVYRNHSIGFTQSYYNIHQFDQPWKLFSYYLYNRQTTPFAYGALFEIQTQLICHSTKIGFTESFWVSKGFLKNQLLGEFDLLRGSKGISIYDRTGASREKEITSYYNIEQTNNPEGVKRRMTFLARSIISGRTWPPFTQKGLIDAGQKLGFHPWYWFEETQLHLVERHGIRLLEHVSGIEVYSDRFGLQTCYHADQTSDPLKFLKVFSQERLYWVVFRDLVTFRKFRSSDSNILTSIYGRKNFSSRYFIKESDLRKFGAIVKEDEKDNFVRLSAVNWYNLDQLANKRAVTKNEFIYRKQRESSAEIFKENIDILEDILGESE